MAKTDNENEKPSTYQKKIGTFTLLVYFRNGYTQGCKFHSWKQEKRKFNGAEIKDERYALNRLVDLVENRFKETYKTAIIYYNPTKRQIMQYSYDMLKHKERIQWDYLPNGDVKFRVNEEPFKNIQAVKIKSDEEMNYKV
jgi:hypothetical protein